MTPARYAKAVAAFVSVVSSVVGALLAQGLLHGNAQQIATVIVAVCGVLATTASVYAVPNSQPKQPVPPSPASMLHPYDGPSGA